MGALKIKQDDLNNSNPQKPSFFWIGLSLVGLLFLIFAWPSLTLLSKIYAESDGYSHAFMVPFVSGFATYQLWKNKQQGVFSPSWVGIPIIATGIIISLFGYWHYISLFNSLSGVAVILCIGLLLCILGFYIICGGLTTLRVFAFPLVYCIFLIPFPVSVTLFLTRKLRHIVSSVSEDILMMLGIAVFREGNVLHLANSSLGIADACSGMNSFWMLTAGAALIAYLTKLRITETIVLCLLTFPISIVMNAIRVVVTALLVSWFGGEFAEGWRHELCGWLAFVCGAVMVMCIGNLFSSEDTPQSEKKEGNQQASQRLEPTPKSKKLSLMFCVGLLFTFGALGNHIICDHYITLAEKRTKQERKSLSELPNKIGHFRNIRDSELEEIFRNTLKADEYLIREYMTNDNQRVQLRVFYWKPLDNHETSKTSKPSSGPGTHYPDNCFPSWGFTRIEGYDIDFNIPDRMSQPAAVRLFEKSGLQQCVLFWCRDQQDVMPLTSKDSLDRAQELFNSWNKPILTHKAQYTVTIVVDVEKSYGLARRTGISFAQKLAKILPEYGIDL